MPSWSHSCAVWPLALSLFTLFSVIRAYNLNTKAAKVFSDPSRHPRLRPSYFGYSVALYSGQNFGSPLLLVGAPRANTQPELIEPGAVFKCSLHGSCEEWALDRTQNGRVNGLSYGFQIRDNSWTGASISVENSDQPRIIVCSPRWRLELAGTWHMPGICYFTVITSDRSFYDAALYQRLMPLVDYNHLTDVYANNEKYYYYGMGEFGFSVNTATDGAEWLALFGSPGLYNWKGGPVLTSQIGYGGSFTNIIPKNRIKIYRYLGYSVTSGRYFDANERMFAAGAPQTVEDMKGLVMLLFSDKSTSVNWNPILWGSQHGEYFGAALASCDIDSDGKDELIVGAPLWTLNGDEGRIYIYTARDQKKYLMTSSWIDGKVRDGRFGSSVACLGDVDHDGFKDIAVGAPYENEHGAIYIFNGRHDGLSKSWSQRISGDEFSQSIRGFGVSISEPRDIDGNGYFDIGVGASLSGHAVMLRAHSVVSVGISMEHEDGVELLNNSSSVLIQLCSSYTGIFVPETLKILITINVDTALGRAKLHYWTNTDGTYTINGTLVRDKEFCSVLTVDLMKNIQNVVDPLELTASLTLDDNAQASAFHEEFQSSRDFCLSCPVINERLSTTSVTMKLPFGLDCGPDKVCHSRIITSASTSILNNLFTLGSKKSVYLYVNVNNDGEAAYGAKTHLLLPRSVTLIILPPDCVENIQGNGTIEVICNIGNPLRTHKNSSFQLDMSQVKSTDKSVEIVTFATTQSENVNSDESRSNITIYFDVDVDATVVGKAVEDTFDFESAKKEEMKVVRLRHIYEVRKFGITPIEELLLEIFVPTHVIDHRSNNKVEIARINTTDLTQSSTMINVDRSNCVSEAKIENTQRNLNYITREVSSSEKTLLLDCTNPSVTCTKISCTLASSDSSTIAEVTVTIDVEFRNLIDLVKNEKNLIYFVSNGQVNVTVPSGIVQKPGNAPDFVIVKTIFTSLQATGRVAIWIIAISVILGVILLILLTLGLIKLGFFNRKRKEQLNALIEDEDNRHGIVIETTSSREALDQD